MDAENASKLVDLADSLSYLQTKRHLDNNEKIILKQILMGKKYDNIECIKKKGGKYSNQYIKDTLIPKLWDHLSEAFGKPIGQKNISDELKRLQLQKQKSKVPSWIRVIVNKRTKLENNTIVNSSSLGETKEIYCLNSEGTSQNTARLNTSPASSNQLALTGQQFNTSPDTEEQKDEDDAAEQTQAELHRSYLVSATDNFGKPNSKYGWRISMRSMKYGLALLIVGGAFGTWFGLSWLANWYGVKSHLTGQLPKAELSYKFALKLIPFSPLSAPTHYNLGQVYEDQQDYKQAKAQYQLAIKGGLIPAYNNQARLYILAGNYDAAIALLRVAIPLEKDENARYSMLKNRGWARLEQGRLEEAHLDLTEAIALRSDHAPAYCLLAQVLERQGENTEAISQWENCLGYSYQPQTPEEDKWISLAQQRLKAEEGTK
jgi:tetratricopeptide (TPR) repeat protein